MGHIIIVASTLAIVIPLRWLLLHWAEQPVVDRIYTFSRFLGNHLLAVEGAVGILIILFLEMVVRMYRRARLGKLALESGLFLYCPNASQKEIQASKQVLKEQSENCSNIHIFCASGWDTFGKPGSPLHETMRRCDKAEVVLLNPESQAARKRAEDLGIAPDDYISNIRQSIAYINSIRKGGDNPERFQLKTYDSYPYWKYIFLEKQVWIQQYPPNGTVQCSPCYTFERIADRDGGIYKNLMQYFIRRWNSNRLGRYDFQKGRIADS
jgi:hypothetical protein